MPVDTLVQEDDLRASIEAEFSKAETTAGDDTPPAPDHEPLSNGVEEIEPDKADASAKVDHPTDPARYADGTFKKSKSDGAPEKVAAPEQVSPPVDNGTKPATEQPSKAAGQAPVSWAADAKAEWSKLSPAVQQAVLKREAEASSGFKQKSEEIRRYEATLAPLVQETQRLGIPLEQGLNSLLGAHRMLEQNAPRAIAMLAQQYGVDLSKLAGQSAEVSAQPDISALVQQAVQPLLAPIQQRMMAEESEKQQSILNFVDQFAAAPGHEHFEAVQSDIMDLIPGIKARNPGWDHARVLQEAYDRAVFANPETRASILSAKEAESEAKRVAEAKARAEKARKAGSSVNGAPNGAAAAQPKDSLRAEIEAAFSGQ